MRRVLVAAPDGTKWTVRVAWEPRWRALARRFGGWRRRRTGPTDSTGGMDFLSPVADIGGADLGDTIVAIVVVFFAVVLAVVVFWWVLLPLLLLVLDAVAVLVLLVLAIAGRVLLRRPWTVEAVTPGGELFTANVVGWRAAIRRRDEIAESLRTGATRSTV